MSHQVIGASLLAAVLCVATLPQAVSAEGEGTSTEVEKPRPKAKADKKKSYDYDNSKYKSYKVLTGPEGHTYKFDQKGKPVSTKARKKPSAKKAKPKPPEEEAGQEESETTAPAQVAPRPAKKAPRPKADVYYCTMGCYEGPRTSDGRCPKCGMMLEKK